MTHPALHDLGVAQLATELRERRVSAVEAAQHFLARAHTHQHLGAYVALNEEATLAQARAAVEALASKQVDLAWFGGFTFVQANARSGGKAVPLVQRAEDAQFRSVFITSNPAVKTLADLKGKKIGRASCRERV